MLDPGWAEGYTVNGLAPQPVTEADRNGRLAFGFGHIPAGQSLIFFMSLQVNPTNVGRRYYSVTGIVLAAGTIGLLATVTAFITYRSNRIRSAIEGEPVILVQDGQPIERNMKNERLTLEEVMEQARLQQGIESLDEVKWAVLETNGSISVIEKK